MIEFLQNPKVSMVFSLVGLVFGIIGAISAYFSIKSYFDQKKLSNTFGEIFEKVQNDWKGKYTEDQIGKLSKQFENLTNQVTTEIPLMAKKVLVEMKLEMLMGEIVNLTNEYKSLKNDYDSIMSSLIIDESIMKYIENEIEPKSNSKKSIKNMLLIISIAFVLFFINPATSYLIEEVVSITIASSGAHLRFYHVGTYISALIVVIGIVYNFNLIKILKLTKIGKAKKFILSVVLLSLWAIAILILSYDLFLRSNEFQLILGIISLMFFAVATQLLTHVFKK